MHNHLLAACLSFALPISALAQDTCHRDDWLHALCGMPVSYSIADYGAALQKNKLRIVRHMQAMNVPQPDALAVLAVAMQETNHMDANERDASKDNQGAAANKSAFNMNVDMLQRVGWDAKTAPDLNDPKNLEASVTYLLRAIRHFTLNGFLAFHRGGWTGWHAFVEGGQDGYHKDDVYDVQGYINCFVTLVQALQKDATLWTDTRRVEVYCAHK